MSWIMKKLCIVALAVSGGVLVMASQARSSDEKRSPEFAPPPSLRPSGIVCGLVYDSKTGKGIANATVLLTSRISGAAFAKTVTTSGGGFKLTNIATGRYGISAEHATYGVTKAEVIAANGREVFVKLVY